MMRFLFAIALLLAAFPASADSWEYLAIGADKVRFSIDTSTIRSDSTGTTRKKLVWMKEELPPPHTQGTVDYSLVELDCMGRFRIVRQYRTVPGEGRSDIGRPVDWDYTPPGTDKSYLESRVCK